MKTIKFEVGADGVALLTIDDPAKPMNVVTPDFRNDLRAAIDQVAADPAIKGAVITSGKSAFVAGADLKEIVTMCGKVTVEQGAAFSAQVSIEVYRRLETCGKPFVAAVNGLALGGGLELALACHYRVIADDPKAFIGLPEVNLGLLPGWGGLVRITRIAGLETGVKLLLEGRNISPKEALQLGLVDAVVPREQLVEAARKMILGSPDPVRVWDKPGAKGPSADEIAKVQALRADLAAGTASQNYPAPLVIVDSVLDGLKTSFDEALRIEGVGIGKLIASPVSRNIIRTNFVNKGEAGKLARRPAGIAKSQVKKLGVLGAGMMGSAIAHVSALAGIDVVLLDSSAELAEKGKGYSAKLLGSEVQKGKRKQADADALLAKIKATASYADLDGCDLVVEAVFEDRAIKADVTKKAEAAMPATAVFASNTSTLPITELAQASQRPAQFVGLHFFSPVDRMPLVEVIVGKQTSPETLARGLDFVGQLKKIPIVVNDSRGFYTSRVFGTFVHEGMRMLLDGVSPESIEAAGVAIGMSVGPLAVIDEVTLDLGLKIQKQTEADLGAQYAPLPGTPVLKRMVEEFQRPGKRFGKGFYDYHSDGKKALWAGLEDAFPPAARQPSLEELKTRLLYIQALETARCVEEGVITHPTDADLGSILGWSFPLWTGGTLSFIDTVGIRVFVAECERLAKQYGPRFAPSAWLKARAERNESFY